ncbi:MAG TPA: hypothetical protein VFW19_10710 [Allosphingosinicella sp.]|nr:hypothetical protein [Allosphingosinicella sp.]
MTFLALDLSKKSTGWALWHDGQERPACGTWELGSELTGPGLVFLRLHKRINDIHIVTPIDSVTYEKPLDPATLGRNTSFDVPFLLIGLAAHVESYCEAKRIRHCAHVHQATWRRHFLGSMRRGVRTPDLKAYAIEQCRQLGIMPGRHDAAEAVGILDFSLHLAGIVPPWRLDTPLTAQIGRAR